MVHLPRAHRTLHPVSAVVAVLEGACLGLVAVLSVVGGSLLLGAEGALWSALHVRAADLLVALTLGLVAASYAGGVHRASRGRWWAHCLLLVAVFTLYILGEAAVQDADGAAGREHIGAVFRVTPGPMFTLVLHAVAGLLLACGMVRYSYHLWKRAPPTSAGEARLHPVAAVIAAALAATGALVWPVVSRAPLLTIATVPNPPWPALALVPLEARMPLATAVTFVAVACAALLLVPFVDRASRPPWVRRFTTSMLFLILLTFLSLMLVGAMVPETEHVL